MKMPRRLQATPIRLINAMSPAVCVRSEHHQKSAWLQEPSAFLQHSERVRDMLNKMNRRDGIKRLILKLLICERPEVHRDASFPRLSHRHRIEIDALDLPTQFFHQLKLCTAAASQFQEPTMGFGLEVENTKVKICTAYRIQISQKGK